MYMVPSWLMFFLETKRHPKIITIDGAQSRAIPAVRHPCEEHSDLYPLRTFEMPTFPPILEVEILLSNRRRDPQ
jgi:hypothetical protein